MRHPLPILGVPGDVEPSAPVFVELGELIVRVADAHDGSASRRFAELLMRAGGRPPSEPPQRADVDIVIRSTPESPEAQLRAEVLEESAHFVLGSPREAFATMLADHYASR